MKQTWIPVLCALLVALVFVGWIIFGKEVEFPKEGAVTPSKLQGSTLYDGAPLTARYKNETFGFSLNIPEGFTVGELPKDEQEGTAIVLQNEKGEGIQIYIVPAADTKTLTAQDIRATIQDMKVEAEEIVTIGSEYTGVAFLSNNAAFDGASREVWFYFRGNLYQISTYQRLDTLLKAMFATWKFL